ncbi:MAG: hypothetical protein ACR2GA_05705 [Chloroflexota bacterium]
MRTQIWIIGGAFTLFGVLAWVFTYYSPTYIGLILFGVVLFFIGLFSASK